MKHVKYIQIKISGNFKTFCHPHLDILRIMCPTVFNN